MGKYGRRFAAVREPQEQLCEWFALCARPATTTRPHPIIGDVPICDECDAKIERLGGAR